METLIVSSLILLLIFMSTIQAIGGPSNTIKPFMVGSVGVSVSMCSIKF